jgi:hypothetical protein
MISLVDFEYKSNFEAHYSDSTDGASHVTFAPSHLFTGYRRLPEPAKFPDSLVARR